MGRYGKGMTRDYFEGARAKEKEFASFAIGPLAKSVGDRQLTSLLADTFVGQVISVCDEKGARFIHESPPELTAAVYRHLSEAPKLVERLLRNAGLARTGAQGREVLPGQMGEAWFGHKDNAWGEPNPHLHRQFFERTFCPDKDRWFRTDDRLLYITGPVAELGVRFAWFHSLRNDLRLPVEYADGSIRFPFAPPELHGPTARGEAMERHHAKRGRGDSPEEWDRTARETRNPPKGFAYERRVPDAERLRAFYGTAPAVARATEVECVRLVHSVTKDLARERGRVTPLEQAAEVLRRADERHPPFLLASAIEFVQEHCRDYGMHVAKDRHNTYFFLRESGRTWERLLGKAQLVEAEKDRNAGVLDSAGRVKAEGPAERVITAASPTPLWRAHVEAMSVAFADGWTPFMERLGIAERNFKLARKPKLALERGDSVIVTDFTTVEADRLDRFVDYALARGASVGLVEGRADFRKFIDQARTLEPGRLYVLEHERHPS